MWIAGWLRKAPSQEVHGIEARELGAVDGGQ